MMLVRKVEGGYIRPVNKPKDKEEIMGIDNMKEMCGNIVPQEPEQWWIFTFGCGHEHAGYYVKVFGTFRGARAKMFEKYGDKWAFQYSAVEWDEWSKDPDRMWYMEKELEVIE